MAKRDSLPILFLFLSVLGQPLKGQEGDQDTTRIHLSEITITGSRFSPFSWRSNRLVHTLGPERLAASPAADLAGKLEFLPDLDVRQRGPAGVQADISIRGGTFDQIAILLNGILMNDPQTGHFSMDLPVPAGMVNRIEVLPGSDLQSLGAGAMTGAINFITERPRQSGAKLGFSYGRWGYSDIQASGSRITGKSWQQGGLEWQRSDGYRKNTDFKRFTAFTHLGTMWGRTEAGLMAGLQAKKFGANSFYTSLYPDQYEETGTCFIAATLARNGRINYRQSLFHRFHLDEFHLFRYEAPGWYNGPNHHLSGTSGLRMDTWTGQKGYETSLGVEVRRESVWSTVLGEPVEAARPVPLNPEVDYSRHAARAHSSITLGQQAKVGPLSLNGSVVAHYFWSKGHRFGLYPGMNASMDINPVMRAYLNMHRGFRLPSFTELYYRSPTHAGNPGLLPESAWHAETGMRFRSGKVNGHLNVYYRYAPQSVDWVRLASETVWHTENLSRIHTAGAEAMVSWSPGQTGRTGGIAIERLETGIRRQFQDHSVSGWQSMYIMDYLKWKVSSSVHIRLGRDFNLILYLTGQDRAGSYTTYDSGGQPIEIEYQPFWTVDGRFSWRLGNISAFLSCTNLFGVKHFDFAGMEQPGAWFRLGVNAEWSGPTDRLTN